MFVFVFGFGFGTQLFMVEQTPIVYQAQTQTLGYETGFEHKNLCLCRSTQNVFVFSERTLYSSTSGPFRFTVHCTLVPGTVLYTNKRDNNIC